MSIDMLKIQSSPRLYIKTRCQRRMRSRVRPPVVAPYSGILYTMKVVENLSLAELLIMAEKMYGTLVKADVDVVKKIMIVDMDMHVDGEAYLLEHGSRQEDIWGINLHPAHFGTNDFIEFDSMINIRPRQKNPSRDVLDESIRQQIRDIVSSIIHE